MLRKPTIAFVHLYFSMCCRRALCQYISRRIITMDQNLIIQKIKENQQQAKQLNEVMNIINEAFKKEMPVYMKLIQFDVMSKFSADALKDSSVSNGDSMKQLTQDLDKILAQINADLKKQIMMKSAELKEAVR